MIFNYYETYQSFSKKVHDKIKIERKTNMELNNGKLLKMFNFERKYNTTNKMMMMHQFSMKFSQKFVIWVRLEALEYSWRWVRKVFSWQFNFSPQVVKNKKNEHGIFAICSYKTSIKKYSPPIFLWFRSLCVYKNISMILLTSMPTMYTLNTSTYNVSETTDGS